MALYLAKITVTLRKSILDPQGKAVHHALGSLGMTAVDDVRLGKYVEMKVNGSTREEAEQLTRQACSRLLANPVMEDFQFTLEKV
ncbi:MAG TPA: phosphoribosylformylglycinamidine synthase subunit PurS [Bacteroidota bacterium]|nr:phosphoribosylformylglycinamidine synthase subunit PurS [Bacteroidota bacterium]